MRDIKFRAWNKKGKKMFQVNDIEGLMQITIVSCKHGSGCEEMKGIDGYEDEVVLMQYTGLKDKNGKEIYEGDIVKWSYDGRRSIVKWSDSYGGFVFSECHGVCTAWDYSLNVIGNIHENPELLEVTKQP